MLSGRLTYFIIFSALAQLLTFVMAAPALAAASYNIGADGGDCANVGIWNNDAKTCTLATDITENGGNPTFTITGNGITLDGNGHEITGSGKTGTGVLVGPGINGVTVKNLKIKLYDRGIFSDTAGTGSGNFFYNNQIREVNSGILLNNSSDLEMVGNYISGCDTGIIVAIASGSNHIENNSVSACIYGVDVQSGDGNVISGNIFDAIYLDIFMRSSNNVIRFNQFFGDTAEGYLTQAYDSGSGNLFSYNYYDMYDSPAEGCHNLTPFDDFCDDPLVIEGSGLAADDNPYLLPGGWSRKDFTWYDNTGGRNWILAANPAGSAADLWIDLRVAGAAKSWPALPGYAPGQVPPGKTITATFPGIMGGPVEVISRGSSLTDPVVSQRTLWPADGNSLEEVPGTSATRLSDTFWWPWYDAKSPGFKNWVLVSNPNSFSIYTEIFIGGGDPVATKIIAGGRQYVATFPDLMGGPVMVKAFVDDGTRSKPAKAMASQRVLSNGDTAFNEVPGTPASELSGEYYWTWYDMTGGTKNWILVANPPGNTEAIYYDISIGDEMVLISAGPIEPGGYETRTFPGKIGGPVKVSTYFAGGASAPSIASQRSIWGPSFEEVPGMSADNLSNTANWTWYDQLSAGAVNWVLVANPNDETIIATVKFTDQATGQNVEAQMQLEKNQKWTPTFPGNMGGPVQVSAVQAGTSTPADIIASQRVLWNGYFNEVWGQS